MACIMGRDRVVEQLLARNEIDVNLHRNQVILPGGVCYVCVRICGPVRHLKAVTLLFFFCLCKKGQTALYQACIAGHDRDVEQLLARNDIDVNAQTTTVSLCGSVCSVCVHFLWSVPDYEAVLLVSFTCAKRVRQHYTSLA